MSDPVPTIELHALNDLEEQYYRRALQRAHRHCLAWAALACTELITLAIVLAR